MQRHSPHRTRTVVAILLALIVTGGVSLLLPAGGVSGASPPSSVRASATGSVPAPVSYPSGLNASLVLGQLNFSLAPALTNGTTLRGPEDAVFDAHGDLWVADTANNRILEFTTPFTAGAPPFLVLGQPNFTANAARLGANGLRAPAGLAFDSRGDLWVADSANDRVLEFVPPFFTDEPATSVLGAPNFTSRTPGNSSSQLNDPVALAFNASGALWVSDRGNNRIVGFTSPFTNETAASVVLGQPTFDRSAPGTSATQLRSPTGIAFDSTGALYVADSGNNRLLAFNASSGSGAAANLVLGQPNFTAAAPGVGAAALNSPSYLSIGTNQGLWVADTNNNRVLEFTPPFSSTRPAAIVLGQPGVSSRSAHTSATGMSGPEAVIAGPAGSLVVIESVNSRVTSFTAPLANGSAAASVLGQWNLQSSTTAPTATNFATPTSVAFDGYGDLWVVDRANNRVLEYTAPFTVGEAASVVIGQGDLNDSLHGTSASTLNEPTAIAFTPNGDLWVADTGNNRVLGYVPPFTTGMLATIVLGQLAFDTNAPGTTARTLDVPTALASDGTGDLFVADTNNNRVLEFQGPIISTAAAFRVLGQTNFTSAIAASGPQGLDLPTGLAFDTLGHLYVADSGNNRVLRFSAPFANGASANGVLGQSNFYSAGAGNGPAALQDPIGLSTDTSGILWVADAGNNRVVRYATPIANGSSAASVLGQTAFDTGAPGTTAGALRDPTAVLADPVSGGGLWVADTGNSRLLFYPAHTKVVQSTTAVLGSDGAVVTALSDAGVMINIAGGTPSANLLFVAAALSAPPGFSVGPFGNQSYFSLAVYAPGPGSVTACFRQPNTTYTGAVDFWTGLAWIPATNAGFAQGTACASFSLATLNGTVVAVEVPVPSPPAATTDYWPWIALGIGVLIGGAGVFGYTAWRRREAAPTVATPPPTPPPPGA